MADIKYQRVRELEAMGRGPINLPTEINFSGHETRQRTPGRHHLPQYQETGTYYHVELCKQRLRVMQDYLKRFRSQKATDTERAKYGENEELLNSTVNEFLMDLEDAIKRDMRNLPLRSSEEGRMEDEKPKSKAKAKKAEKKEEVEEVIEEVVEEVEEEVVEEKAPAKKSTTKK